MIRSRNESGLCRKGHGSPTRILLVTRVLGSLAGDLLILHMPLIIPLPLFVLSQNCGTAGLALVWLYAPSVWCGAVRRASIFWELYGKRLHTYCYNLTALERTLSSIFVSFPPYSPVVYNVR